MQSQSQLQEIEGSKLRLQGELNVAHRRSTLEMADRIVPIWPAAAAAKRAG